MNTAMAMRNPVDGPRLSPQESALLGNDLAYLSDSERVQLIVAISESLGLNPLTGPLSIINTRDGGMKLYVTKAGAAQIAAKQGGSFEIRSAREEDDLYVVIGRVSTADGRFTESIGVVPLTKEGGEWMDNGRGKRFFKGNGTFLRLSPADRANARMTAATKAERRGRLDHFGLGFIDESEADTIPGAELAPAPMQVREVRQTARNPQAQYRPEPSTPESVPAQRQIAQTVTDESTGEITEAPPPPAATVAEEDKPAPSAWIVALRGLVDQLAQFGVHEELPAGVLTRGQARVIKAALIDTLALAKEQAEQSPL